MTTATATTALTAFTTTDAAPKPGQPKQDWPLMGDVASFRAGVPEALIAWRKAQGEELPLPSDPDLLHK